MQMPLYIYPLLLSIGFSAGITITVQKRVAKTAICLIVCLLVGIALLAMGFISGNYLLLNESNTDVMNISGQLFAPSMNFTVFKHFVFYLVDIIFIVLNTDLLSDNEHIKKLLANIVKIFRALFVLIIFEWAFVNINGGFNDRQIMGIIFSLPQMNQIINWMTWGSYSVALGFTERSEMVIVLIYYLIFLKQESYSTWDFLWLIISYIAIYCTGSSSALTVGILAAVIYLALTRLSSKHILFGGILLVTSIYLYIHYGNVFGSKTQDFLSAYRSSKNYGSAFWRAQSIEYAVKAFKQNPLFGVGIGTVYTHGMLFEVLTNIGLIGTFFSIQLLYYAVGSFSISKKNAALIAMVIVVSYGSLMVENFTSPLMLLIFIIFEYERRMFNE
ncbi:O-antigen ligase family protein [Lactobacillus delbrueckii subsp. bulgaricus]